MTFRQVFGPLDGLLRTLTAFAIYFSAKYLEGLAGSPLPFLAAEAVAVACGLAVSGFLSEHVWRLPRLHLTWELDGRTVQGTAIQLRIGDPRNRRLVTHHVVGGQTSLVGKWIAYRIKRDGVDLHLVTTANIFRMTRDSGSFTVQRSLTGFSHDVPTCAQAGLIGLVRMYWQPIKPAVPVVCPVTYELKSRTDRNKWLIRLVLLEPTVDKVELVN